MAISFVSFVSAVLLPLLVGAVQTAPTRRCVAVAGSTGRVAQHKGDKEGQVRFGRHVYANPGDPKICPVLAVAVLTFSKTYRGAGGRQQLFEGAKAESRFSDILLSTIDKLNDGQLMILGVDKKDIGTHSCRKGCPSYLLGIVDGPDPVKVYLRAGWSLGNVQDRYIYEGTA